MKTLLITNSYDETSDFLLSDLAPEQVFRLNYDLIKEYEIFFEGAEYTITNSAFSVSKNEIVKVFWRKAFLGAEIFDGNITRFHAAEYKYILREIMNFSRNENKFVLNFPDADNFSGKIYQNSIATKYFKIPETFFISSQNPIEINENKIIKSLSSKTFEDGKVLYTTDISGKTLKPKNPYYIQDKISSKYDVTIVYVYGKLFSYCLDRELFKGLDWRNNPFEMAMHWRPFEISEQSKNGVKFIMSELGWSYGRLDFLTDGNELVFLEVNPNGQWGWLDPNKDNGLFSAMRDCIDPNKPMPIIQA
jgi:hypothetical protein